MKKVLLLFMKGTEIFEAGAFYDVLGWSGTEGGEEIEVTAAGPEMIITCTFGLTVHMDILIDDVDVNDYDAIAVPGGFEDYGFYEDAYSSKISEFIRAFHDTGKIIGSICVGALAVAKTGILKNRNATTYHLNDGRRRKQLAEFGVNVLDKSIVADGNIITSKAPSSAVGSALKLLEMLTGKENRDRIEKLMGFLEHNP